MYREDMLFVGTQSDLLAYNVEANSDVWFKDAADGVSTMTFGNVPSLPSPLALVGGNCSIQGFDQAGEELYWTVVGDNVSALAMVDTTGDGNVRRRLPACLSTVKIPPACSASPTPVYSPAARLHSTRRLRHESAATVTAVSLCAARGGPLGRAMQLSRRIERTQATHVCVAQHCGTPAAVGLRLSESVCPVQEELVVGSEDFEIRVYQNEEILSEVTEVDRVLHLCPIHDSLYGYGARRDVGIRSTHRAPRCTAQYGV